MPTADITRVRNEDKDLYGRNYWFNHQDELGNPSLEERSVSDLSGRCLHWMEALLAYRLPPARVLELGASHGGFVALLEQAGFEATGLEISPWVAGFARDAFGVTMLEGPIEDQQIAPASFDIVVALDILEHLPDPIGTISRCCDLLSEEGILLLQTPCRPPSLSVEHLRNDNHPFARMLLPEHLFLFPREALGELLSRVGLKEFVFDAPAFESDMFVLAGRHPLSKNKAGLIEEKLKQSAGGRLSLSRLDLARKRSRLEYDFLQADDDRIGRQDQIESLHRILEQHEADRESKHRFLEAEKQALIERLETLESGIELLHQESLQAETAAEDDRRTIAGLRDKSDDMQLKIGEFERAQAELEGTVQTLRHDVGTAEHAAAQKQFEIDELRTRVDRACAGEETARSDLADAEADYGRLNAALEDERRILQAYVVAVADRNENSAWLSERLRTVGALLDDFRRSRVYRLMVQSGRWRRFDELMDRAMTDRRMPKTPARTANPDGLETWVVPDAGPISAGNHNRTIAVDLTSLLAGAENGGAKLVATELVRSLADLAPEWDFVLLTTDACHDELAFLDRRNVRRRCATVHPWDFTQILDEEPIALLFGPMTAPPFHDPRVPVVSVVHDLQHYTYPEFFADEDRAGRDRAFQHAIAWSDRIVTVSDYVRTTVLEHSTLSPERVVTIHNGLADRLADPGAQEIDEALSRYGLEPGGYLLYPANFWSHKNHRMLLTAFSLFLHHHPETGPRLVLTGSDRPDPGPIREAARRMGLDGQVVIPGYVPEADLAFLLAGCRALVFPSLYEGFGIPVTEAMAMGRPVICSQVTSLPEVAGDAALLVDPRKPEDLAAAMEKVWSDNDLVEDLVSRGLHRVSALGRRQQMARAYLDLFESVLTDPRRFTNALGGVFPDRWCGAGFVVSYGEGTTELRLELANQREDAVALSTTVGSFARHVSLAPHESLALTCRLPDQPGCLEFMVSSTFCPSERGPSSDTRYLGLKVTACHLSGRDNIDLLAELGYG